MNAQGTPGIGAVLRTFHPNFVRYPFGKRDLRRWFLPSGVPPSEDDYTLTGFVCTQSLFLHIPKAAGTSVAQNLYGNLAGGHRVIGEYQRVMQKSALDRMFTFTFVRNPWDRAFSAYNFLKAGGWPAADAEYTERFLADCSSFEQFVNDILPQDVAREKVHFLPMAHFLKGLDGQWFGFDFVGRFERFAQDFEIVRQKVNPAAKVTHRNITSGTEKRDYRSAYTPEMIEIVSDLYAQDIKALGYSFEGFEDRYPVRA